MSESSNKSLSSPVNRLVAFLIPSSILVCTDLGMSGFLLLIAVNALCLIDNHVALRIF